jgi:hypothetical protein
MRIKNPKLLASFPSPGLCEGCGIPCSSRERHHIFGKGAGGPDLRCNIIMLGDAFTDQCACHAVFHNEGGAVDRFTFLGVVAKREGTTPEAIEDVVNMVRNKLPKNPSEHTIRRAIHELDTLAAVMLAVRELAEYLK